MEVTHAGPVPPLPCAKRIWRGNTSMAYVMDQRDSFFKTHGAAIGFCASLAASYAFMGLVTKSYSSMFGVFATYGLAALFFLAVKARHVPELLSKAKQAWPKVLAINVLTLLIVLIAFEALKLITPLSYVIAFFGLTPFLSQARSGQIPGKRRPMATALAVLLMACAIASNPEVSMPAVFWTGMVAVAAYLGVIYLEMSSSLQKLANMSSGDVMLIRFVLAIVFCGLFFPDDGYAVLNDSRSVGVILATAVLSTIIPLYLMQKSLASVGVNQTSRWFPIIPAVSLLASMATGQVHPGPAIVLSAGVAAASFFFYSAAIESGRTP